MLWGVSVQVPALAALPVLLNCNKQAVEPVEPFATANITLSGQTRGAL